MGRISPDRGPMTTFESGKCSQNSKYKYGNQHKYINKYKIQLRTNTDKLYQSLLPGDRRPLWNHHQRNSIARPQVPIFSFCQLSYKWILFGSNFFLNLSYKQILFGRLPPLDIWLVGRRALVACNKEHYK